MQIKECVLIEPYTCNEDELIVEVAKKLRKTTLRHVFVVNKESHPQGIISVLDINNRVVAEGKDPAVMKAKDIMTKPIDLINFADDAELVAKSMIQKSRAMNAVVRDKKIVGIITITELLRMVKV